MRCAQGSRLARTDWRRQLRASRPQRTPGPPLNSLDHRRKCDCQGRRPLPMQLCPRWGGGRTGPTHLALQRTWSGDNCGGNGVRATNAVAANGRPGTFCFGVQREVRPRLGLSGRHRDSASHHR